MKNYYVSQQGLFISIVRRSEIDRLRSRVGNGYVPNDTPTEDQETVIRNGCPEPHDAGTLAEHAEFYATDDGEQGWCCGFCGMILDIRRIMGRRRRRSPGGPRA